MANIKRATSDHEDFYLEVSAQFNRSIKAHPRLTTHEVAAILGRLAGMGICTVAPPHRFLMREVMVYNMDAAIAQHGHEVK